MPKKVCSLILEAIVVGIVLTAIGLLVSLIGMYMSVKDFEPKQYKFWGNIAVSLFISGVITHLLFEWFGGNRWYCENGYACQR